MFLIIQQENINWIKYKNPNDEPEASSQRDMNTFLSLIQDMDVDKFPEVLEVVHRTEKVASNMDDYWSDCVTSDNLHAIERSQDYLLKFYSLIIENFDKATAKCLIYIDNVINDKGEFYIEETTENSKLGMWTSFTEIRMNYKEVMFKKLGIKIEVPKQLFNQEIRYITRVTRIPIDIFSCVIYQQNSINKETSDTENLSNSKYYVVGDILNFDLLLPLSPPYNLRGKKWILRDYSASSLVPKKVTYPSQVAIKCSLELQSTVIMSDDIHIALWDNNIKEWIEDGLSKFQYNEQERLVQFSLTTTGTLALVKNRTIDFPYKKWSLFPIVPPANSTENKFTNQKLDERCARFTITTSKHDIVIDIIETKCVLVQPVLSELSDMIGNKLNPGQLVRKLLHRGINIFPVYSDNIPDNYPKVSNFNNMYTYMSNAILQSEGLEDDVLLAIARCSSALDFTSSKWNKDLSPSQIGILVRESTVATGQADVFDYESVLAEVDSQSESKLNAPDILDTIPGKSGTKYTLVAGNEYGSKRHYSLAPRPNEQTHVNFNMTLQSRLTEESKERIDRGSERFHKTVYKLLKLVKPFSF